MARIEQRVMIACGLLLIHPAEAADIIGLAGIAVVLLMHCLGRRRAARLSP